MVDEIVSEFLVESHENLDQLDQDLVRLEDDPRNTEILASIFRTVHTIKGTCGFLGFDKLERVSHVGENLLSKLRDGELTLDAERTSALLSMVDAIREMLARIEQTEGEGDGDYSALIAELERLQDPEATAPDSAPPPAPAPEETPAETCEAPPEPDNFGDVLIKTGKATAEQVAEAAERQQQGDPRRMGEILVAMGVIQSADVLDTLTTQQTAKGSISESTIRVDVEHLDKLMNLVGELVLARNQILQFENEGQDGTFSATTQRLNLITTELQEGVMKTRMQPIGNVWNKLPRIVRDLSRAAGKEVEVVMEGKETELDKTIIEAIRDPLTHLVRNAVDHGIEDPEARRAEGKPACGTLLLRAFHEGGQVNIEISEDGRGLDVDKLRAKAVERGLISQEQASRMSEREIQNLIFAPGFSTAAKVTNISGRGVGMDVVKTNIEKIGGQIDLQSTPGRGTTFKIKIPLTLAIIPALIVTCGGDRYAIPQVSLLELVRLEGEQIDQHIDMIDDVPVYRLRGHLLPLVRLDQALGLDDTRGELDGDEDRVFNIVILRADNRPFGLIVDEVNDTEEIVVKPLGKQLKSIDVYAGATIMGDGKVALILDGLGLASQANLLSEEIRTAEAASAESWGDSGDLRTLLVFRVGESRRVALPLDAVARLEEFEAETVERTGKRNVVQYRGALMPLISLAEELGEPAPELSGDRKVQVVVYGTGQRNVGLVVEEILDIVDQRFTVDDASRGSGILGATVIHGKVTDLLDLDGVVGRIDRIQAPEAAPEPSEVLV
jgi:two-component system chemotaxis sensor kinase CheA